MPQAIQSGSKSGPALFEVRSLVTIAGLAAVYFAAGKLGLFFAVVDPSASPVWPASGIAMGALLLFGRKVWPGVFIGALLVNLSASGRPLVSIAIASGNTLEAILGAYFFARFNGGRCGFDRPADIGRFFVLAALLSPAAGATVGATSLVLGGGTPAIDFGAVWLTWWFGDAVGVLIFTPLILLWANDSRVRWRSDRIAEAIALLIATVLIGLVSFGGWPPPRLANYPLDFLCMPLLVWVAFRFGQREAATAVLVLSATALMGTLAGVGPFIGNSPNDSQLLLQVFLGLTALLTLVFAALVSESRRGHDAMALMATIVTSTTDAIVTKSLDGKITSWNPAAEKLYGFTAKEAIGQDIMLIVPPEYRHEEEMVLAKLRRGEGVDRLETVRLCRDGARIPVSLTISPAMSLEGEVIGVSNIGRDIRDRVRFEEARNAHLAREQEARVAAEAGNRAKDEFLAILSHELRTPLNAVYGWARMMQTQKLDDETATRALDAIVRNANAQVQLIDDLLDVSRIVNGRMRLDVRPIDFREVIEAALDAVRPAAGAKKIHVEALLDPRGGMVDGDPGRLQQIVWNLLINAVKFTPKGGHVQVCMRRADDHVEVVVSDTGQGIPAHVLPFVFDRFRQWDSSSSRAQGGLGLGLALVKHLTELHRGTVAATSAGERTGSTFTVTLPLTVSAHLLSGRTSEVPDPARATGVRLDGLRVLAVDDDPDALGLTSAILVGAGATVKTCRSAGDALTLLQDWRPDVLVSDIAMPGEDGYSLIRKVRLLDDDQGARTPAVALTAYGRTEDRVRTLSSGFSMHVPKPVDPDEFTTIIASLARTLRSPAPNRGHTGD